jgi:SAM-dependent methyltransferase
LDIGCSSGLLLSQFKKAFSSQAVGIEPGDAYRKFAQDLELEVFTSLEELGKIDDRQFDLISLAHVLEHIPQPLEYLRNLKNKWLSPNGHLLVEVPNLYGHDCFEIAHMISYSHHTLRETLRQAGFQITTVKLHGEPRSKILALYITALAEPLQSGSISPPVPEKNVRLKRKYGMLRRQIQARLFPKKAWLPVNNVSL